MGYGFCFFTLGFMCILGLGEAVIKVEIFILLCLG